MSDTQLKNILFNLNKAQLDELASKLSLDTGAIDKSSEKSQAADIWQLATQPGGPGGKRLEEELPKPVHKKPVPPRPPSDRPKNQVPFRVACTSLVGAVGVHVPSFWSHSWEASGHADWLMDVLVAVAVCAFFLACFLAMGHRDNRSAGPGINVEERVIITLFLMWAQGQHPLANAGYLQTHLLMTPRQMKVVKHLLEKLLQ